MSKKNTKKTKSSRKSTTRATNNTKPGQKPQPSKPQPASEARRAKPERPKPVLRFTPDAWAKLHYFCHRGNTEIGGFGVADPEDPLLVTEFVTVAQSASVAHVAFDDEAVADYFDAQVDAGRKPEQFARLWCHTHPGDSPHPSGTDEATFSRVFGACQWAVMFIIAKRGQTYARLRFGVGPGGEVIIPVAMDWSRPFAGSDHAAWEAEYEANVKPTTAITGVAELNAINELGVDPAWLDDAEYFGGSGLAWGDEPEPDTFGFDDESEMIQ